MSLTERSTPLTVPEDAMATAINIPMPGDTSFSASQLFVTVTPLLSDGTVLQQEFKLPASAQARTGEGVGGCSEYLGSKISSAPRRLPL